MNNMWWSLALGAGSAALLLLSISTGLGMAQASKGSVAGWSGRNLYEVHRSVSLGGLLFTALHAVGLVLLKGGTAGLLMLIPFAAGGVVIALGALALLVLALISGTALARKYLPPKFCRVIHWLAYLTWAMAFIHAILAVLGPASWFAKLSLAISAVIVGAGIIVRISQGVKAVA